MKDLPIDEYDVPILDMMSKSLEELKAADEHLLLTGSGCINAVLEQPDTVVVSELKYHSKTKTATLLRNAMKQIHDKKYYGKCLGNDKKIILLGLAFSKKDVGCRMDVMES
ncbi:MAG: PD-(D/E)XK nuclease domain-containing protein [Prevotellaceae bacterium]|jgi:hypothetical protein|nr:PD-(D/E)XK nuclease domain-containing protein [Prevotellaceae bacterium]